MELGDDDDTLKRVKSAVDRQMILAVAKQNEPDRALKLVDTRIKDNPDSWRIVQFKARLQHELGRNDDALKTYDQVIERIKKDDKLTKKEQEDFVDDLQYELTGIYVDNKEIKKATDILEKLLEKDPDNPTYNNDLGFIWADHDLKLAESEKLIRKAIDLDRAERKKNPPVNAEDDHDNAAYLDSLGWVLFKLKNYPEAKKYLLEAVKDKEGQHVEILDHLGDVYMALGEKADAVNTWKNALKVETKTKREKERRTQVEKKLKAQQ
jgi:tetratricopeptide (TPR) repeat protein